MLITLIRLIRLMLKSLTIYYTAYFGADIIFTLLAGAFPDYIERKQNAPSIFLSIIEVLVCLIILKLLKILKNADNFDLQKDIDSIGTN